MPAYLHGIRCRTHTKPATFPPQELRVIISSIILNSNKYVKIHINNACEESSIMRGRASDASSHSFKVIIAIPRKSESEIPPRSLISPMCIVPFPEYSDIFRISAAAIIAPIYIGNVSPVFVSIHEKIVPETNCKYKLEYS